MSREFWGQKSFILITGASRGLGRAMAIEFSRKVGPHSTLLLLARTEVTLEETKSLALKAAPSGQLNIETAMIDLGQPNKEIYFEIIKSAIRGPSGQGKVGDFDQAILVHNAASIGNATNRVSQFDDLEEMQSYYNLNVFSMVLLTSQFFTHFDNPGQERSVIQISSGSGHNPAKTLGYYCSGKAARNMLMRVLADEEPTVGVVNFNPGMFESEMQKEAREKVGDEELRNKFLEAKATGKVGTADGVVKKLCKLLGRRSHTRGEVVHVSEIEDD